MAEVHLLSSRISREGAHRLLAILQDNLASGRDLGPRGAQIQALGLSLENMSQQLQSEVERVTVGPSTEDPVLRAAHTEVLRWRDELMQLADTFMRLGAAVRSYPV